MDPSTLYFVHIPKTAGRYLVVKALNHELIEYKHLPKGRLYRGNPTGRVYYGGHNVCHSAPASPIKYFTADCTQDAEFHSSTSFAIVRNPFDLLVSMFKAGWPYQRGISDHRFPDFEAFIHAYCDEEYPWVVPLQQRFLFFQVLGDEGRCAVDRLLRFEDLDTELAELCAPIGVKPAVDSPFRPSRHGDDRDHRRWYNNTTHDLVRAACAQELEQLGYDFDGICAPLDRERLHVPDFRAVEAELAA